MHKSRHIFSWIVGSFLGLMGLTMLQFNLLGGSIIFVSGLSFIPPLQQQLEQRFGLKVAYRDLIPLSIIGLILGSMLIVQSADYQQQKAEREAKLKKQTQSHRPNRVLTTQPPRSSAGSQSTSAPVFSSKPVIPDVKSAKHQASATPVPKASKPVAPSHPSNLQNQLNAIYQQAEALEGGKEIWLKKAELYKKAVKLKPDDPFAYLQVATNLEYAFKHREAIDFATQGIHLALSSVKRDEKTLGLIWMLYGQRGSSHMSIYNCPAMKQDIREKCKYDKSTTAADCEQEIRDLSCEAFVAADKQERQEKGLPLP